MKLRNPRSIIIISAFAVINILVISASFIQRPAEKELPGKAAKKLAPDYTLIDDLNYFHLKDGIPQMSLAADKMRSLGEVMAEFDFPKGVYNYQEKNQSLLYQGETALYDKHKSLLILERAAKINSEEGEYVADKVQYFMDRDLVLGDGNVKFIGEDPKTHDEIIINSDKMRANPEKQYSLFEGQVKGSMQRKKKYEGKITFASRSLELEGAKSLAHLEGDVVMTRQAYLITSGKADIFLENYNKSLKYFVLNDDVKVTETLNTPKGVAYRRAFSERLEGFGMEQKMILSGAPRVEMGTDVIKGYRITIRENIDLVEVDDAMSDMQVKRKKLKE